MSEKIIPKFNVGDVVRLKSGGAVMTVSKLRLIFDHALLKETDFSGDVYCTWIPRTQKRTRAFNQDTLELVK